MVSSSVSSLPPNSSHPTHPHPAPHRDGRSPLSCDVAIVGGGIVGLTLAIALEQSGLSVAVVEAQSRDVSCSRRRAYHITLMSGRIFEGLGVWDAILPQVTTFRQIRLADEHHASVVQLQPTDLGTPALGYVAEHGVLAQALYERLDQMNHVTWLCPATVIGVDDQPDQAILHLDDAAPVQTIRTRLVVAADGARSPLRQQAGIATQGWQYWQSCITAVIRPEQPHGDVAREHFWASGPFATLPLPHNRAQIVLTAPHAEAQQWMAMDETDFLAALDHRYQHQLGKLTLEGDRLLFPVQLMHSDRYTRPRLALVGDAAHCCHPVGGQGMNLGIRDAAALAQVLQRAVQRGEDVGHPAVLKRYERWRWWENLMILGFTDLLDRMFSNRIGPIVISRRLGLRLLQRLRPLRFLALRLMTGLSGRTPDLARWPNTPQDSRNT